MIRLFLRLAGFVALSIVVILATSDAMRSLSGSMVVLTPLGESWAFGSPGTLASVRDKLGGDSVAADSLFGLLNLPGSVVFLMIAVLLLLIGRRPRALPETASR
jgi:hypothetical protein